MAVNFSPTGIYKLEAGVAPEIAVRNYLKQKGISVPYAELKQMTEKVLATAGRTYATAKNIATGQEFDLSVLDADVVAKGGTPIKPQAPAPTAGQLQPLQAGERRDIFTPQNPINLLNPLGLSGDPITDLFSLVQGSLRNNRAPAQPTVSNIPSANTPGLVLNPGSFNRIDALGVPQTTQEAFTFNGAKEFNNIVGAISGRNALAATGRNIFFDRDVQS